MQWIPTLFGVVFKGTLDVAYIWLGRGVEVLKAEVAMLAGVVLGEELEVGRRGKGR